MQVMSTLITWMLVALLSAGTVALICRCIIWGTSGWMAHRLQAEQARAARLQAQAHIETARAHERAAVATAEAQAQANVAIAQVKARADVAIGEMQARSMLARLAHHEPDNKRGGGPAGPAMHIASEPAPAGEERLPDLVHLRDIAHSVRPGYFAYGMLSGGQLVQKPITSAYHTLLHGETRSGKTTSIHSLVVQAHVLARVTDVRLYMTDVKRELGAAWGRSPILAAPAQNDAASAGQLITELVRGADGVLARYREFERLAQAQGVICASMRDYERHHPEGTRQRPALVFVVIDELNALLETARKADELHRSLTILLQTGAAAGYYVIAGAQYLNAKVLGRDATQQFVSRAHFGAHDPIALRMLFGQTPPQVETAEVPAGRGFIRVQGQSTVLAFQGIFCDQHTILDAQQQLRLARRPVAAPRAVAAPVSFADYRARTTPVERSQDHMGEPSEDQEVLPTPSCTERNPSIAFQSDFPPSHAMLTDPEKTRKVAILLAASGGKRKPTKTAIIAEVWGVTGGRRYTEANLEYEAIVATLADSAIGVA